jgi:hypothetical protein
VIVRGIISKEALFPFPFASDSWLSIRFKATNFRLQQALGCASIRMFQKIRLVGSQNRNAQILKMK